MKPILFNTAMVQAILEGRKSCTRRIVKDVDYNYTYLGSDKQKANVSFARNTTGLPLKIKIPYKVGDILYARETWQISNPTGDFARGNRTAEYVYKAGYAKGKRIPIGIDKEKNLGVWKPSIHMPKEAARIFLKVTEVRVEKLDQMIIADCLSEGIRAYTKDEKLYKYAVDEDQYTWQNMPRNPHQAFKDLWDSTLKKEQIEQYGFNANPWVWVIEFERIDKSEVEQ